MAASRSSARNRLPSWDQPRFRDRSWRKMFGPNSPPDRFGIRCPLSTEGLPGSAASGKAALVGDVALANSSGRNGPGRHSAILLSSTRGTGKVEEVGRPRLHELHQRAVRAYALVTFCDRLKQYVANLGGDQRHGEISHQAFVFHRQSGHRLVLPAATGRWPSRSGPGVLNCALRALAQRGMCGRRFSLRCGDRRRCRMDARRVDEDPEPCLRLTWRTSGAKRPELLPGLIRVINANVEMQLLGMRRIRPARRDPFGDPLESQLTKARL